MNKIIEINNITKKFDNFIAVDDISFSLKKGEIVGFLGPNGAGKSTTIKILLGLLKPTYGNGYIDNLDILKDQKKIREKVGYVSQKFSLYNDLTIIDNLNIFASLYNLKKREKNEKIREVLKKFDLEEKKNELVSLLPLGFKQRLSLAASILHDPKLLILDEPTSAVDPISRRNFWSIIHEFSKKGVTCLVSTHYMVEAMYCDKILLMYRGKIIKKGTLSSLKKEEKLEDLEEIFIRSIKEYDENK